MNDQRQKDFLMQRKPIANNQHTHRNYFLLVFIIAAIALTQFWTTPHELIALYVAASALLFSLYGVDKLAAIWGLRRIPESVLHVIALCGGWPGGVLAQQLLAHKSSKITFRQTARTMIALNLTFVAAISLAVVFFFENAP